MQVDDGIVDEGEDSQLELGLAGVAILDHTGVGVGNRAAEGGKCGSLSQLLPRYDSCEHPPFTGIPQPPWKSQELISPQTQTTSAFAWKFQAVLSRQRGWERRCGLSLPVVDEAEGDGVPGVAGWGGPALGQHHLKAALLPVEPHFNFDLITGGHAIILRYGRIPDEQLHFSDEASGAVEVFKDGVDPVGERLGEACFMQSFLVVPPPQKGVLGRLRSQGGAQVKRGDARRAGCKQKA